MDYLRMMDLGLRLIASGKCWQSSTETCEWSSSSGLIHACRFGALRKLLPWMDHKFLDHFFSASSHRWFVQFERGLQGHHQRTERSAVRFSSWSSSPVFKWFHIGAVARIERRMHSVQVGWICALKFEHWRNERLYVVILTLDYKLKSEIKVQLAKSSIMIVLFIFIFGHLDETIVTATFCMKYVTCLDVICKCFILYVSKVVEL